MDQQCTCACLILRKLMIISSFQLVLFNHLYSIGVNGKAWRLIIMVVNVLWNLMENVLRSHERYKQGSILFPTLFLTIMDQLLRRLKVSKLGLSINSLSMGAYLHVDDFCLINNWERSFSSQRKTSSHALNVNFYAAQKATLLLIIDNTTLPISKEAKCFGYNYLDTELKCYTYGRAKY